MRTQAGLHAGVGDDLRGVQLGVATGQPHGIAVGQRSILHGREEHHACAHLFEQLNVGGVDEAERGIPPHGHRAAFEQGGHGRRVRGQGKIHRPALQVRGRHLAQWCGLQRIGGGIQALPAVGQLVRRHQAQVPFGQQGPCDPGSARIGAGGHPHQRAQPVAGCAQARPQHVGVARAAHAIGQHTRPGQARAVVLQAKRQRTKGARHGRRIHHRQHGHAEALGQVGGAGVAIEQAHHTFYQDEVGFLRRRMQALGAVGLAGHPQVELVHGRTAGKLVPVRVEKIRPALEDAHLQALARVQPRQGGSHRGLALARGRGRNQQRGAACSGGGRQGHCGAHFTPTYSVRPGVA